VICEVVDTTRFYASGGADGDAHSLRAESNVHNAQSTKTGKRVYVGLATESVSILAVRRPGEKEAGSISGPLAPKFFMKHTDIAQELNAAIERYETEAFFGGTTSSDVHPKPVTMETLLEAARSVSKIPDCHLEASEYGMLMLMRWLEKVGVQKAEEMPSAVIGSIPIVTREWMPKHIAAFVKNGVIEVIINLDTGTMLQMPEVSDLRFGNE
jgi:hypothetical protein